MRREWVYWYEKMEFYGKFIVFRIIEFNDISSWKIVIEICLMVIYGEWFHCSQVGRGCFLNFEPPNPLKYVPWCHQQIKISQKSKKHFWRICSRVGWKKFLQINNNFYYRHFSPKWYEQVREINSVRSNNNLIYLYRIII